MAGRKLTIAQKKAQRDQAKAAHKATQPKEVGKRPLDKLVADINAELGGRGRVFLGADIRQREFARRSSGIPSIDFVLSGGLPIGGLVEIGGEYSTGKTTIALKMCAYDQQNVQWLKEPADRKAIGWIALEPFSKRWAREVGFHIPYSEEETVDPVTGEVGRLDSWENASHLEQERLAALGIGPYDSLGDFVLVQEERGDVALDIALKMLESNLFSIIVVDSLGVAKSTSWVDEKSVQDSNDFDRNAKMIGDYTTRACLKLNMRYDENNQPANDGKHFNETTLVHINQVVTAIGTQAMAPWKKFAIKGGEGNKHNHHAIIFLWKGQALQVEQQVGNLGKEKYTYGTTVQVITIKSKLGAPFLQGEYDFYFQPYGMFRPGDIDIAKDATTLGLQAGLIGRRGAWLDYAEGSHNGRPAFEQWLRDNPALLDQLVKDAIKQLRGN
jgi:RecA/RadA recombinase